MAEDREETGDFEFSQMKPWQAIVLIAAEFLAELTGIALGWIIAHIIGLV